MNATIIGIGNVGLAIAKRLHALGHQLAMVARDPGSESVRKALAAVPALRVVGAHEAANEADVIVLSTPFEAAESALRSVGSSLDGKVVIDCTNPVGPGLSHGLGSKCSATTQLQTALPAALIVKAFSIYGYANFATDPRSTFGRAPLMLIAGDDATAKAGVASLLRDAGWDPLDAGDAAAALHLEHLALLWIKLVVLHGHDERLTWARLTH